MPAFTMKNGGQCVMSFYLQKGLYTLRIIVAISLTAALTAGCVRKAPEPVLEPFAGLEVSSGPVTESGIRPDDSSEPVTEPSIDLEASAEEKRKAGSAAETGQNSRIRAVMTVHVCGAVENEGVYLLPEGSRIMDAVEAAGGFTKDADREFLNLALEVEDAWQIRVPYLRETEETGALTEVTAVSQPGQKDMGREQGSLKGAAAQKININTASVEELMTIPGIGESKARRILEYREANGKFESVEDIMNVKGIKENSFQKMRDYICT